MTIDAFGNIEVFGYDGVLAIGDTHITERTGRRIDDFSTAILGKVDQAADVAIERNLFPVHLGDLFNRARENSLELLARTAASLQRFPLPVGMGLPVVVGSHDPVETTLTDKDAMQLLATFGRVFPMGKPGKVLTLVLNSGERVGLWVTPAGSRVPERIDAEPGTHNIMFTHHDFDFNGLYPDAHELHEIEGCDLMINGHMHKATPMVLKGRTACHNPGSLARVKVDERNHKPVVSVWTPAHGLSLEAVPLKFAEHVFDMTGKEVYAADDRTLKANLPKGLSLSRFAAKYRQRDSLEAGRTDDGSVLAEELDGYFQMTAAPDNLRRYMANMLAEVVEARKAA
ncbi:metallophosphoesterase [Paraburkholderia sp. EG287A]|uniref:metallophosphoesterase n=1 Tax=Paraburkholderia sp. EG287A TaxID=3237012 RepID=UPI0034D1EB31